MLYKTIRKINKKKPQKQKNPENQTKTKNPKSKNKRRKSLQSLKQVVTYDLPQALVEWV